MPWRLWFLLIAAMILFAIAQLLALQGLNAMLGD